MKTVDIKATIKIPEGVECTEVQIREWIEFKIGSCCSMNNDNPLTDYHFEQVDLRDMMVY